MPTDNGHPMQLSTPVDVGEPLRPWDVADRFVFLGSCFARHMGSRLADARLSCSVNPLGPLYSPASLTASLTGPGMLSEIDCAQGPLGWHTWLTDTALSRGTIAEALQSAKEATQSLAQSLTQCTQLVLTLGTNRFYRLKADGRVVVNCHKHPACEFSEEQQTVEQIGTQMGDALRPLLEQNPQLIVTLTVSPYRYAKYGFHESQLSKATLLLACDQLQRQFPHRVQYFPAYEIVLDELRDYRFFDADMLHPSSLAAQFICERLSTWMTPDLLRYLQRWKPIGRALAHRPTDPQSASYHAFREQTHRQMEQLQQDYPMLNITK